LCVVLQDVVCWQVRERLKKMGHLQPLNIFLRQEIDRMRKVLTIVKATLTDLKLAIDGTIIMNEVGESSCTLSAPSRLYQLILHVVLITFYLFFGRQLGRALRTMCLAICLSIRSLSVCNACMVAKPYVAEGQRDKLDIERRRVPIGCQYSYHVFIRSVLTAIMNAKFLGYGM